ncbi:cation diffusion facilitator family transporter [Borrelia coriaceae]|uniref:cation diffusion facilitator family transporter n=1 Tax=Borrelia coriaceae TaxID=144 RepID=UPI00048280C1|nr:cation diffusion facilitator family transporter [Borrelia coriaceae]UPA16463.1 cation diffusion facilitator family transporter [Borrelia coriaceae]
MVKIINNKNINKCTHLELASLKKDEIYIVYIENNVEIVSYLKAKIQNKEIKINNFYINPNFKAEGIERILIHNLIHYGKKNKMQKILCQINDIEEELKNLGFGNNNNIYEKELTYEIKKNTLIMRIGLISVLAEVASIASKLTVGILFNSFALIADALHVTSDFILSTITYFSLKITNRPETIYYPYGYKRMENLIALIIGLVIIISGFTIFLSTTGLNKLVDLSSKFELHSHHHDHSHDDKKNILEIFSNNSFKKSIWIPLIPFIFFLVKIIEHLVKFQIGNRYNNHLLLALSSFDKNCIFSHGGTTLSLLLANYVWTGFDKIISICISFIMIKEGLHVIINNANNLLSKQDLNLKREIKNTLKNINVNFKELNFSYQGNELNLYIKLDLSHENDLKSLIQKTETIKDTIKKYHKEICKIYILM